MESYRDHRAGASLDHTCHKLRALQIGAAHFLAPAYNLYLDRRVADRHALGDVITELTRQNVVTRGNVAAALQKVYADAADLLPDLPFCYLYIAQYLGEFGGENEGK